VGIPTRKASESLCNGKNSIDEYRYLTVQLHLNLYGYSEENIIPLNCVSTPSISFDAAPYQDVILVAHALNFVPIS